MQVIQQRVTVSTEYDHSDAPFKTPIVGAELASLR